MTLCDICSNFTLITHTHLFRIIVFCVVLVIVLCYRLYAVPLLLCCTVICVALLLFVLSYVLIVCTVPLPPGVNPIAVDKYIKYVERNYLCLMFLGTLHVCSRFLISNFRCVVNVVFFLLDDSSASEFYIPTFRNTLFHLHRSCEQEVPVIFFGHKTYEDGTDKAFRNVGT